MRKEMEGLFLYILAAVSLLAAIAEGIGLLTDRGKTRETEATVVDAWVAAPGGRYASKWARVHYVVDGRRSTSRERIQVPMAFQTGSRLKIRCRTDDPGRLCRRSVKRLGILLAAAAACGAVGYLIG